MKLWLVNTEESSTPIRFKLVEILNEEEVSTMYSPDSEVDMATLTQRLVNLDPLQGRVKTSLMHPTSEITYKGCTQKVLLGGTITILQYLPLDSALTATYIPLKGEVEEWSLSTLYSQIDERVEKIRAQLEEAPAPEDLPTELLVGEFTGTPI